MARTGLEVVMKIPDKTNRIAGAAVVAALLSFPGCMNTRSTTGCDPDRLVLYQSVLEHALIDSAVAAEWGNVYESGEYYVFGSDNSRVGMGIWRYELASIVLGEPFSRDEQEHRTVLEEIYDYDKVRYDQNSIIPDACLMLLSGDSTKKLVVACHNYNDSVLLVDLKENRLYHEKLMSAENKVAAYAPPTEIKFLFVHDGESIGKVLRSGPWYW